ncbi:MAG: MBL fold metallo-hydrolase [Chloroflexota bacterium]
MNQPIRLELPTPFSIGSVNGWLFKDPEPTLVDCGQKTDDCINTLVDGLAEHGLTLSDLKKVIITHGHVDHAGLGGYLAERCDAEFWVSDLCWDWVADPLGMWHKRTDFMHDVAIKGGMAPETAAAITSAMKHMNQIWDAVPVERMARFTSQDKLQMGGDEWDVIEAPGHSSTQTCFYEPGTGRLISADMLLPIAPVPVIERYAEEDEDGKAVRIPGLLQFMDSLKLFYELDVSTVYPGHGDIFADPHTVVIDRQRDRIAMRKQQCLNLVTQGKQNANDIVDVMYAHFPPESRITGFAMVIGYLDLLLADKSITREEIDGIWYFSPA